MDSSLGPIPTTWNVPTPVANMFAGATSIQIRAVLLGGRITPGGTEAWRKLADKPLAIAGRGSGCAMVFRYGAVVFFGIGADEEREICERLTVREPLARAETETVELRLDRAFEADPRIEDGVIFVPDDNLQRLQVIAEALAKSVVLADHENAIARAFDRIEPLAQNLNE
ncbi:MAG TPA: RMD1 family protein, partial [Polyangiales bacterium]